MAYVLIALIRAKCRHFKRQTLLHHQHETKLSADRNGSLKQFFDLIRGRRRRHVKIFRLFFKQKISHATADKIGFMAVTTQRLDDAKSKIFFIFYDWHK